ncbi:TetR/AcrR family transcriptional regulator [Williamsia muralis]|uniref:TetR/AcrR family transcriptional regulator n=1 Tax=Williamsia marianensis TaxID=85044 RepID=UPI001CB98394|nr:TetR/AcrR family transcriptional regulator [Williamsia marianensis]
MTVQRSVDTAAVSRIKHAAIEVFSESGYGGASTREITKRLGLSAAAIYPHFASKEELLFAISLDGHRGALSAVSNADNPADDYPTRLRSVVSAFAHWQAENNALARVVQYELHALAPAHYKVIAGLRRNTTAVIAHIVDEGTSHGDFNTPNPHDAVLAISSLCVDVCRWFPSTEHRDPARLGLAYANIATKLVT